MYKNKLRKKFSINEIKKKRRKTRKNCVQSFDYLQHLQFSIHKTKENKVRLPYQRYEIAKWI